MINQFFSFLAAEFCPFLSPGEKSENVIFFPSSSKSGAIVYNVRINTVVHLYTLCLYCTLLANLADF